MTPIEIISAIRTGIVNAEHRFSNGGCFQLYRVLKELFPLEWRVRPMIDLVSVWRGLRVMKLRNGAKWAVKWMPRRFWLDAWTPV